MFNGHLLKQLPVFTESWVIGHTHTTTPTLLVVLIACCKSQTQRVSIAMGWKGPSCSGVCLEERSLAPGLIGFGSPQHQLWHMVCYVVWFLCWGYFFNFWIKKALFSLRATWPGNTPMCRSQRVTHPWSMNLSTFPLLGHVKDSAGQLANQWGHRPDKNKLGYRIYSNIIVCM